MLVTKPINFNRFNNSTINFNNSSRAEGYMVFDGLSLSWKPGKEIVPLKKSTDCCNHLKEILIKL